MPPVDIRKYTQMYCRLEVAQRLADVGNLELYTKHETCYSSDRAFYLKKEKEKWQKCMETKVTKMAALLSVLLCSAVIINYIEQTVILRPYVGSLRLNRWTSNTPAGKLTPSHYQTVNHFNILYRIDRLLHKFRPVDVVRKPLWRAIG